jgi:hypothetical protein
LTCIILVYFKAGEDKCAQEASFGYREGVRALENVDLPAALDRWILLDTNKRMTDDTMTRREKDVVIGR